MNAVEIPVRVAEAYNQSTEFEHFPQFIRDVTKVNRKLSPFVLDWRATVDGRPVEGDVEIIEMVPDTRIGWRSLNGPPAAGVLEFEAIHEDLCQVRLAVTAEGIHPDELQARVREALVGFRDFMAERGAATGAWRGHLS